MSIRAVSLNCLYVLLYSLRFKYHLILFPNYTYSYTQDGLGKGGSKYYSYNIWTRPIETLNLYIRAVPFVCLFLLSQNLRFKHHLYV